MRLPWALSVLASRYENGAENEIKGGRSYPWLTRSFRKYLPEYEPLYRRLGERISRRQLVEICRAVVTDDEQTAVEAFVAVMAWGFGTGAGYGAYRTAGILEQPNAASKIARIAAAGLTASPVDSWRVAAAPDNELDGYGPAFWTKFTCICSLVGRSESEGYVVGVAPILDSLVSGWIYGETGVWLDSQSRSSEAYERYVAMVDRWGQQLRLRTDIVEELIFRAADRRNEPDPALDPRHGWSAEAIVDHQVLERFRYHFDGRLDESTAMALDGLDFRLRGQVMDG